MRRREPTVVLWGGRPGIDRQFGSEYDLLHERMRRDFAQLANRVRLTISTFEAACPAASPSLERFSKAQRKGGKG